MTSTHEQVKRTLEIEEVTNRYFIHPISRVLVTYFARWGVRPNIVSVFGIAFGALAALSYYHYQQPLMAVLGLALMIGWHIMDGSDGQLARLTGQASELGKIMDGVSDHLTWVLLYLSLTLAAAQELGPWVWAVAALAGISHSLQSAAYEFQRQAYDYFAFGRKSARIVSPEEFEESVAGSQGLFWRVMNPMRLGYLRNQFRTAGIDPVLLAELEHALDQTSDPEAIRDAYRRYNLEAVKRWSLLCSNYRTVAIFIACLAGVPVFYFLFEIVVLNGVLLWLQYAQHRQNRALSDWLVNVEVAEEVEPAFS